MRLDCDGIGDENNQEMIKLYSSLRVHPKPHLFLTRTRCHASRAFNWLIETWRPTKSIEFNAELIDD